MKNIRKAWLAVIGGGVLSCIGLGTLLWWQHGQIEEARANVASLRANIETSRKLIEGTGALEREVIVLRELTEVMKGILPDTNDVNNLVRTIQRFSDESGVRIAGLKKKAEQTNRKEKNDFDKVAYTLSLEGDAFQYLDFLDLVESHSRFMRVPAFRISATQRNQLEKEGVPAHKVTIDVETYVYEPKKDQKPIKIDGYDRKRDLLLGEIDRRKGSLQVSTYAYRGARGRRDPWIDPRVPVQPDAPSPLTVQEQMDLVQSLVERTQAVLGKWEAVKVAENVIVEMTTRAELEELLAKLEEDIRRVLSEKSIVYVPSQTRLGVEVVDVVSQLRTTVASAEQGRGPTEAQLKEIESSMVAHREKGEFKLMLEAFGMVDNRLATIENDPLRKPLVERLRDLAYEARTVLDFEKVKMTVGGVFLIEGGAPVAMINGRTVTEGDLLQNDLVVLAIKREEIEFIFRGIVFARRF
ncbi:MAG: type 4a pilus biogenesis protein PilO [Planctomycetes bacterium]|nr:type 4a pilus biogenesis protein PilO [Planctomycetota bacterium]